MCGIAGIVDLEGRRRVTPEDVGAMTEALTHRGPDSSGVHLEPDVGLGVRRLRIIDLETGDQPIYNEDGSLVLVCNGEIFNYRELRRELAARGHAFRTRTDVEVLLHLYEEEGVEAVHRLNGQFAFAVYDRRARRLFLARDHFGVNPLYTSVVDGLFLFASEIKALLRHPAVARRVDLVGLDQVLSLPGLVSPRTFFAGIESLPSGHLVLIEDGRVTSREYWDLDYPPAGEIAARPEEEYVEGLRERFESSVRRRLQADVPVGLFVSGGIDSSLVAAVAARTSPGVTRHAFSVTFMEAEIDESRYQDLVIRALDCRHHRILVDAEAIVGRLQDMLFHCECPVKETFNTCSLALSAAARAAGVPVILAGEGADELFGGYPGYRFDAAGKRRNGQAVAVEDAFEEELREDLWGDRDLFYEKDQLPVREEKLALYSRRVAESFAEVDCLRRPLVNKQRLRGRHVVHQRSYLDFKLRLADHLLSEHGDRMVMANSVEGRYPFLDVELVEFARQVPPELKVNGFVDKYVVRRMAQGLVPQQILEREKFGFRAPGSPALLQRGTEWVWDLLAPDLVRRRGIFDVEAVERLKRRYSQEGFRLHPHLESDLLMVVLSVHLLCEMFALSAV